MNKQYLAKTFIILLCTTTFFNTNTLILAKEENSQEAFVEQELHIAFDAYIQQLNTAKVHLQQLSELIALKSITVENPEKLVLNIKEIQEEIELLTSFFDANYTIDTVLHLGQLSKHIILYLTETAQTSTALLNANDLTVFITKALEHPDFEQDLSVIISENEKNLNLLGEVCDTAGLSQFSKTYRFLSKNNVFWALKQTAFWGTIAGIVGFYILWEPRDTMTANGLMDKKDAARLFADKVSQNDSFFAERAKAQIIPNASSSWWNNLSITCTPLDNFRKAFHGKTGIDMISAIPQGIINAIFVASIIESSTGWIKGTWRDLTYLSTDALDNLDRHLKGEKLKEKSIISQASFKRTKFNEMINGEHLAKIAEEYIDYINHPERYDRTGTAPSKGILLVGPPQTGKSLFANALLTAIEERCEKFTKSFKFFSFTQSDLARMKLSIEDVFSIAYNNAPAILFFDEIDMMGVNREQNSWDTSAFLTQMSGLMSEHGDKQVFVLAATNKPERLDFALLQKGRLGRIVPFEYPPVHARQAHIEKQLIKRNIEMNAQFIAQLAKETEGLSYNAITEIIVEALRNAKQNMRLVVQADILESFDKHIRKIAPYSHKEYTTEDKKYIATYQAGRAVAIKTLQPNTNIAKVTILPVIKNINTENIWEGIINKKDDKNIAHEKPFTKESYQFGSVFTYHAQESLILKNTHDIENEYIALTAGAIAQELLFNNSSLTLFKEDYAKANALLYELTQNEFYGEKERVHAMKAKEQVLREKAKHLLAQHQPQIEKIQQALIEKNTIDEATFTSLMQ